MKIALAIAVASVLAAADASAQHHPTTPPRRERVVVHHPPRPHPPAKWNNTHHRRPVHVHPVAPIGRPRVVVANYHLKVSHPFKFGFFYTGWNHNHWSYHYWDTRYGAYLYYDPYALQYYYWCAPHFRFYPITYVPLGFVFPYVAQPVAPVGPIPDPPPVDPGTPPGVAPPPPVPVPPPMPPAKD